MRGPAFYNATLWLFCLWHTCQAWYRLVTLKQNDRFQIAIVVIGTVVTIAMAVAWCYLVVD